MVCPQCNKEIADGARICPACGAYIPAAQEPAVPDSPDTTDPWRPAGPGGPGAPGGTAQWIYPRTPPRSPHLCWWNLLITGLAQMIHGQMGKGILLLTLTIASNMMFPLLLGLMIGIASIVDAFMVGKVLKRGFPVGKWEWFPKRI